MSDGDGKGLLKAIVDGAVDVMKKIAPKVPARAAPVVLMVFLGLLLLAALAVTAVASNGVIGAIVALVAVGVLAWVLLAGRAAPAEEAAPGDTLSLKDRLDGQQRDAVCAIVASAVADVADALGADPENLRGNVFGCDGNGQLRIMTEFGHNMNTVSERSIEMPIGQGSTGHAWQTGRPNIAIRHEDWGEHGLAYDQEQRLHPDLKWIISAPVFAPEQPPPPTWMLNVDGLRETRTKEDLSLGVGKVMLWAEQLGRVVDAASGGSR